MKRALVTGGAGFIGSHLVAGLIDAGFEVRVLDDLSRGSRANLCGLEQRIEFVLGDIRDAALVAASCRDIDVVFHLAANPSVVESVEQPVQTNAVNLGGTVCLLEAARTQDVTRFVFASSCAVYGDDERLPKCENMEALPLSPYALQKYAAERYCRLYSRLYGLECVVLRYFNVYGPRQDPGSDYAAVVPRFAQAAVRGAPVNIFGDGGQTRDFVFVTDVVDANLRAARAEKVGGEVINIASGRQTSVSELVAAMGEAVGRPLVCDFEPPRAGEVRHSVADIGRAEARLGFRPAYDLEAGLRCVVEHFAELEPAPEPTARIGAKESS